MVDQKPTSAAQKTNIRVRYYRFRNSLRDKLMDLSGGGAEGSVNLDPDAMARAEAVFQQASEDYPDWVMSTIQELSELHRRCVDDPNVRRGNFEKIARIAHDLQGQGATFGYPLVTSFSTSLNRLASIKNNITDDHVEVIKAHIDAMRAVIRERIVGDGGALGLELARGLDDVIRRYRPYGDGGVQGLE